MIRADIFFPTTVENNIKTGVRDFCLPPLAVRVTTKTLSTCVYVIGSAVAYSVTAVVVVKPWINCFECHTVPTALHCSLDSLADRFAAR